MASSSIVTGSVVSFLKNIPPFQFLPVAELSDLADSMALEYFPKDAVILRAGSKAADALYIVQKGGVKLSIRSGAGKEMILDMRSEGEIFGLLSLMARDTTRLDVIALEETLCYTIPADDMQDLISRHAEVKDYLFRTSITRYMDRSIHQLRERALLMGDGERMLYSLRVKDAVRRQPLVCSEAVSIVDAARLVTEARSSSLFVTGSDGKAAGIVTDKDFTRKVVARELPLDSPVTRIMSSPVLAVEHDQPLFQALLLMLNRDVHHLLVTMNGLPHGVLTNHDFTLLQGKSPLSLVRHIEQQRSIEGLVSAKKYVAELLPLLLREGARASHITRVVAEMNDRLMAKILEFAHAKLGPAPGPYCWITYGSEGRIEQTFSTDQDNGIIYADEGSDEYFEQLAEFARTALEQCGYPPCAGNFMATNPLWRQPVAAWKSYFEHWIHSADRRSVEDALILLDMRPLGGDTALFDSIASHVRQLVQGSGFFKSVLGFISISEKPPLGFFRTFVVQRSGEHKHQLDLKQSGTQLIVNAARLLALDAGVDRTNTVDRLTALESMPGEDAALLHDLRESFEFLTLLRLESQLQQARAGEVLSNFIEPDALTNLQRSLLKEAFHTITRAQSLIEARFKTAVWAQMAMR